MVAELVPLGREDDPRARLLAVIDAELAKGCTLADASKAAARRAIQERTLEPFWRAHGADLLAGLWRRTNMGNRRPDRLPGERRVNPAALAGGRSLLDALWDVGGHWLPLGDLLRVQVEEVARAYENQERALAAKRRALLAVAAAMPSRTRSVREQMTEDQVRAIFRAEKAA